MKTEVKPKRKKLKTLRFGNHWFKQICLLQDFFEPLKYTLRICKIAYTQHTCAFIGIVLLGTYFGKLGYVGIEETLAGMVHWHKRPMKAGALLVFTVLLLALRTSSKSTFSVYIS